MILEKSENFSENTLSYTGFKKNKKMVHYYTK